MNNSIANTVEDAYGEGEYSTVITNDGWGIQSRESESGYEIEVLDGITGFNACGTSPIVDEE